MTTTFATATPWITQALCRGRPPQWWETGDTGNRLAMTLCRHCPIRALCPQLDPEPVGVVHAGVAYDDDGNPCRICECGQPIVGRTGDPALCSTCAPVVMGACEDCGRLFHRGERNQRQRYCTAKCQDRAAERRRRERRMAEKQVTRPSIRCARCRELFQVGQQADQQLYCTDVCRKRAASARKQIRRQELRGAATAAVVAIAGRRDLTDGGDFAGRRAA